MFERLRFVFLRIPSANTSQKCVIGLSIRSVYTQKIENNYSGISHIPLDTSQLQSKFLISYNNSISGKKEIDSRNRLERDSNPHR